MKVLTRLHRIESMIFLYIIFGPEVGRYMVGGFFLVEAGISIYVALKGKK